MVAENASDESLLEAGYDRARRVTRIRHAPILRQNLRMTRPLVFCLLAISQILASAAAPLPIDLPEGFVAGAVTPLCLRLPGRSPQFTYLAACGTAACRSLTFKPTSTLAAPTSTAAFSESLVAVKPLGSQPVEIAAIRRPFSIRKLLGMVFV